MDDGPKTTAGDGPGAPGAGRILVAEADDMLRPVLVDLLAEKGCESRTAGDGGTLLALLESAPADVALVDLDLPGTDGLALLREIKRVSPETEVVIVASRASLETGIRASRLGAYDYVLKPFEDLDEAWVAVRRALEKRRLSLKNRSLLEDLERRNARLSAAVARLTALIDAGRAMSGLLNISDLLDFFIGQVVKELDAERASIMRLDEETGELRIVASRGIPEDLVRRARVRVGEGVSGWVAQTGKPILVKDVKSDPRALYRSESAMSESFISSPIVLSVPILLAEKVLGVINVTNRRSGGAFSDEDMAFLYGLAGQAAVSIERARHFEELQQAYETLKEAQSQVVAVERLKALGQMAAGVAHDFNNILNAVLGRVELLLLLGDGPKPDSGAVRDGLRVLQRIALQGAETVRRIQDVTRIRKDSDSDVLDVNGIVRSAVEMTRSKWKDECGARGIVIDVSLSLGDIPDTAGNPMEIAQVLSNLIFNAVEAMPRGGVLGFKTFLDGFRIRIDVSDTGVGIPDGIRDRIFEPFFSTKDGGQGLGMSVAYGIIARHGGEIAVRSEPGKGSTFAVTLPVRVPRPKGERPAAPPSGPARVLVIEDDDVNRDIFREYLESFGHVPLCASRGVEGLEIVEREAVDLVITDLSMPGMSGWQVARGVRKIDDGIPVILLSGWAIQQDGDSLREAGVDLVIAKPCSIETFRRKVEEGLLLRRGAQG